MKRNSLGAFLATCILASPAIAQQSPPNQAGIGTDDEWVSITGTVKSAGDGAFTLSHNDNSILVEMDGYKWYQQNPLKVGERVAVTGRVDADFYEQKKLEASSVYVPNRDTYYYADPDDEEGGYYSYPTANYGDDADWIAMTGTAASLSQDTLRLDTGSQTVQVDVGNLGYELKVKSGDRVTVYGEMGETNLSDGGQLEANAIIRLFQG